MTRGRAEERQLAQRLAGASDGALARVVAMVDGMARRQQADRLLDGIRPRLRSLRPPRPMQVTRLLFLPLDGAIVAAADWQRGSPLLPRCALDALAREVAAARPAAVAEIAQAAIGRSFDDAEATGRLGRHLWALAATALSDGAPPGWQQDTGLAPEDHAPLARLCTSLWRHAGPIWDLVEAAAAGPVAEPLVRAALAGPAAAGEASFAAALGTLLRHVPMPGTLCDIAGGLGPTARLAAERGLGGFVDAARPVLDGTDPAGAARLVARFAVVLADIEAAPIGQGAAWRARLHRLRQQAAQDAHGAFSAAVQAMLLAPIAAGTAAPSQAVAGAPSQAVAGAPSQAVAGAIDDAEVERLEEIARALKDLELAGRALGDARGFDDALRALAPVLAATVRSDLPAGLARIDIARLTEILCGRDAARLVLQD